MSLGQFFVLKKMDTTHPHHAVATRLYEMLSALRAQIDARASHHWHIYSSATLAHIITCSSKLGTLRAFAYEIDIPALKREFAVDATTLETEIPKCFFYCMSTADDDRDALAQQRHAAVERYQRIAATIESLP